MKSNGTSLLKKRFILAQGTIYMCGHSLGPMPKSARAAVDQTLDDWKKLAVSAWNKADWINLPQSVASRIAPLIGADPSEVVISDSTSVNLFKVLMSALKLEQNRTVILTTEDNFPADLYIAQGVTAFNPGLTLKTVQVDELIEHLDERVAVLMLTHVNYRDASMHDMKRITEYAHQLGIIVIMDLSHSVGIVPLQLSACGIDFAVGCTYKYLNGGPGSPSFVYVNKEHHNQVECPIFGWMGHDYPFIFTPEYYSTGAARYIGGTPHVLSLKALEGALDVFDTVSVQEIYSQSLSYSKFLINALEEMGLSVLTPKTGDRGGHVAFMHQHGYALSRALIEKGVVCDYREPDLIRLCVNPLYLDLNDLQSCIEYIAQILNDVRALSKKYTRRTKVT